MHLVDIYLMMWQLISSELTELKTEINAMGFAKKEKNAEVPNDHIYIWTGTIVIKSYYNKKQLISQKTSDFNNSSYCDIFNCMSTIIPRDIIFIRRSFLKWTVFNWFNKQTIQIAQRVWNHIWYDFISIEASHSW